MQQHGFRFQQIYAQNIEQSQSGPARLLNQINISNVSKGRKTEAIHDLLQQQQTLLVLAC